MEIESLDQLIGWLNAHIEILDRAILGFGILALILSVCLCAYFMRSDHPLGQSVSYMLFGESCANAMTAIFAAEMVFNWLSLPPLVKSVMRLAIFFPVMFSSVHITAVVVRTIREIINNRSDTSDRRSR